MNEIDRILGGIRADPAALTRRPLADTREGRIALLGQFVREVEADPHPTAAALFLATALAGFLQRDDTRIGALERDHLRIAPERGSRLTPQALARRVITDEPQDGGSGASSEDHEMFSASRHDPTVLDPPASR